MANTPRWFRKDILPFYDAQPGVDWGVAGLLERALENNGAANTPLNDTVKSVNFGGMVKSVEAGEKFLTDIIKTTGLRVITEDLSWDREEDKKTLAVRRVFAVDDQTLIQVTFSEHELQVHCAAMSESLEVMNQLDLFFRENTHKEQVKEYIYAMVQKNGRLQFQRVGAAKVPLIRENYSKEVLEGYDRVIEELNSATPRGRIAIFDGPPGTGKTFMVRSILNDVGGIHVMIPSHMVASLADPSVLPAIIDLKHDTDEPILFIIEDGDEVIAPRGADNMPAISSVLNLGDGIIGACLDVRVVITTNAKRSEMDEAMTRPGRLISIVHIGRLSAEEANEVYKRITGKNGEITQSMTVAEIYSKALDSGFKGAAKKGGGKMGFGS